MDTESTSGPQADLQALKMELAVQQAGQRVSELIEEIDFPTFVRDLLKGVFEANVGVSLKQMDAFQKLLENVTASVATFIDKIDDTEAFGYLAERYPDMFGLGCPDDAETDENGEKKPTLVDGKGKRMDPDDKDLKARITDARVAMARERRALLREVILMGVIRLAGR